MGIQNVPNTNAVKEYHRKNSPPWQADVPYAINDIVFASNGTVYKCILANNTVDPYNDPKDPSDPANALYWEIASGSGGSSSTDYDVDFEVLDTDRKVIALSDNGEIKIADKRDFSLNPMDAYEDVNTPPLYDGNYKVFAGFAYPFGSPWALAEHPYLNSFQYSGAEDEGVRGTFDFATETVLPFALPRPEQTKVDPNHRAVAQGHILVRSSIDNLFYVLKSGVNQWEAVTNLNSALTIHSNNFTWIYSFNNKFFIAEWNQSSTTEYNILRYDPSDDSVVAVDNTGLVNVPGGNGTRYYASGWVDDGTSLYFITTQVAINQVHKINPTSMAIDTVVGTPAVVDSYNDPMPIGYKDGKIYIARKLTTGGNAIVAYDTSLETYSIVAGASVPVVNITNLDAGITGFPAYYFYDDASRYFYAHDDSVGRKVVRSKDLITWADFVVPVLPGTELSRVSPAGDGHLLQESDFLQHMLDATLLTTDVLFHFKTFKINLSENVNRFKALGITSDSKISAEPGKVSKIAVQKIALLDGFTGLTTGPVYMNNDGAITQDIEDIENGEYRILLGYAVSATEVDIQMGEPILNIPNEMLTDSVPIGTLLLMTGMTTPTGTLLADGSEYDRSIYPSLNDVYAKAGYPYGDGNGTTTFNVPDYMEDGIVTHVVKARYISDTSVEENEQIDGRLKVVEDAQTANDAKLANTIDPVLETSSVNVDIIEDQELFMDGTSSVVSSHGRKPISGMNLGDYMPPKIEIDGKWYDNPSVKMFADRGCFAFFEDWNNLNRDFESWAILNDTTVTQEGDWIKVVATANSGFATNDSLPASSTKVHMQFLVKKGIGDVFYIGEGATPATNASYTWSTNSFVSGSIAQAIRSVRLSDTLVWVVAEYDQTGEDNVTIQLESSGDEIYFKDVVGMVDNEFIPPFGQDGNPKNPARAYNFDKWDQPISFKFQPQFGFDTAAGHYIISDAVGVVNTVGFSYNASQNIFQLSINSVKYYFGYDGANWDGGTIDTADATDFVDNVFLQQEHTFSIFKDVENNLVNLWLDNDHVLNDLSVDLSTWEPNKVMYLGGTPEFDSGEFYYNGYISNLVVHPKTQTLPIDQTLPYKDPNKQYGKNAQWFLDQFGGFPGGFPGAELLKGAGGITEEGSNINGNWMRFDSGLLVQFGRTVNQATTLVVPLPISYKDNTYIPMITTPAGAPISTGVIANDETQLTVYNSAAQDAYFLIIGY